MPPSAWTDRGLRIDKLIAGIGLADSNTDATRKVKSGAVEINNTVFKDLVMPDASGMREWAEELVACARAEGVELTGEDGG